MNVPAVPAPQPPCLLYFLCIPTPPPPLLQGRKNKNLDMDELSSEKEGRSAFKARTVENGAEPQEERQSEAAFSVGDRELSEKQAKAGDEGMLPRRQEQPEPERRTKQEGSPERQGKPESKGSPAGKCQAEDHRPRKAKRKSNKGLAHCLEEYKEAL